MVCVVGGKIVVYFGEIVGFGCVFNISKRSLLTEIGSKTTKNANKIKQKQQKVIRKLLKVRENCEKSLKISKKMPTFATKIIKQPN